MMEFSIIDQLVQQGVDTFCLAPGSRSTPLVQAAITHPKAHLHIHFDERGLGFFALGIAKGKQKPVAIIVTSGTAVGNLLPAVMEAHHSYTPIIVLSADRPPELRDCGANQTTDQVKIFQPFVRWQVDLAGHANSQSVRSIIAQASFYAIGSPPGPVHINCPFDEPLYKPNIALEIGKPIQLHIARRQAPPFKTNHAKGLILIGKLPSPEDIHPILKLAQRLNWPVFGDILSNARLFLQEQQIKYYDWNEKPTPDIVLHFGERMTSKKVLSWLKSINKELVHISPYPELQDPERLLSARVQSDIEEFCETFEGKKDPQWLEIWEDIAPEFDENGSFTEVHAMRHIAKTLPAEFGLFLGNGMPIRDADHFLFPKKCVGFFANRGLSGIDGNIATLAGLAESQPMLGIIGDQAALYDLNSLPLLKKTKYPATLLIFNNFGGGIFHHLPIVASPDFENYWAAKHTYSFAKAAKMFSLPYSLDIENLFRNESSVVELVTDRAANFTYQKNVKTLCPNT